MIIDLHSHFFPIEALRHPGKYEERAPKIRLDSDKLSVTSQIGMRTGLGAGAYDAVARIKALDEMNIDVQAISPSPILLFYWEEVAVAAHFSRKQNEAIQSVVQKHADRLVGFGSVPLQSVADAVAIAEEAKNMGLKGLEIGNSVGDNPLSGILGNVLQFTFRTTLMIERMILKGMFEKYTNLRLCLSHGGGLFAFNIWRLDHAYQLRPELQKIIPRKPSEYLNKLYFDSIVHSVAALQYLVQVVGVDRVVVGTDYPMAMGDFESVNKVKQLDLANGERQRILGDNAARALNL